MQEVSKVEMKCPNFADYRSYNEYISDLHGYLKWIDAQFGLEISSSDTEPDNSSSDENSFNVDISLELEKKYKCYENLGKKL